MGAQPGKVHSTLEMLRGTPIEVWNKTEHRWVKAVVGSPKDVRENPPNATAVLVLYQERINGRTDGYKWIRQEDISQLIRARPEMAKEAGMMASVMDTFGTMFDNPSAFEARPKGGQPVSHQGHQGHPVSHQGYQGHHGSHHPMSSACSIQSVPLERPGAQQQQAGMMSTLMASVGLAPTTGNAMMPSTSFASTIDQNSVGMQNNFARAGSMASTIPEDKVGIMDSLMGSMAALRPGQQYNAPVHAAPTMHNYVGDPMQSTMMANQHYGYAPEYKGAEAHRHNAHVPEYQGAGVMASIMGMGGMLGSRTASRADSFAPSMVLGENRSPNRSPMSSVMGSAKGSQYEKIDPHMMVTTNANGPNPMSSSSFMQSFMHAPGGHSAAQMQRGSR